MKCCNVLLINEFIKLSWIEHLLNFLFSLPSCWKCTTLKRFKLKDWLAQCAGIWYEHKWIQVVCKALYIYSVVGIDSL